MPRRLGEPAPNALLLLLELVEFREPLLLELPHYLLGILRVKPHSLPKLYDHVISNRVERRTEAHKLSHHSDATYSSWPDPLGINFQEVSDAKVARQFTEVHEGFQVRELLASDPRYRMGP